MEEVVHILVHAALDSLKVFPFLFLMYVLIELLEHRTNITKNKNVLTGNLAPLLGAATGIIPQCGFSVMAAKLYDKKLIRTGTVLAVFFATSDEAIVLLLSSGSGAKTVAVMPVIAILFAVSVAMGYLFNAVFRREPLAELGEGEEICGTPCGHDHEHDHDNNLHRYFLHPLEHALQIFVYILIVNIAFGFIMHYAEGAIESFLQSGKWYQPLIAAAIGLIPNCAASTVITQAYILNGLTFGGFIAGICANAGLGLTILLKSKKSLGKALIVMGIMYAVSVAVGYAALGIMQAAGM